MNYSTKFSLRLSQLVLIAHYIPSCKQDIFSINVQNNTDKVFDLLMILLRISSCVVYII